jgi:hypothetical protein
MLKNKKKASSIEIGSFMVIDYEQDDWTLG